MYHPRHYRCIACGNKFTLSDGVIVLPSTGVPCPHCGSNNTTKRFLGGLIDTFKFIKNFIHKQITN